MTDDAELARVLALAESYGVSVSAGVRGTIGFVLSGRNGQPPSWWWWSRWADTQARLQQYARGEARKPINQHFAAQRRARRNDSAG